MTLLLSYRRSRHFTLLENNAALYQQKQRRLVEGAYTNRDA